MQLEITRILIVLGNCTILFPRCISSGIPMVLGVIREVRRTMLRKISLLQSSMINSERDGKATYEPSDLGK